MTLCDLGNLWNSHVPCFYSCQKAMSPCVLVVANFDNTCSTLRTLCQLVTVYQIFTIIADKEIVPGC